MNLLLLEADEVTAAGASELSGERAEHMRRVLRVTIGQQLRAGIVDGPLGLATVTDLDPTAIRIHFAATAPRPEPTNVRIALALPRPKVLARALEHLAAFAVDEIAIINAWRVDKSYFSSPLLAPAALATAVRKGAAQAETTRLPVVTIYDRFTQYIETRKTVRGLALHARGGQPMEELRLTPTQPVELALGPEGGWIERELATLTEAGFATVTLGAGVGILRVEAALAAALGQLAMTRRQPLPRS